MKQYCEYCIHMCCGDANYCEVKNKCFKDSTIKTLNKCKDFEFNEISACNFGKIYKPRKKIKSKQIELFEE